MPIEKLEIKLMKDVSGVLENLPIYPCNEKVIHKLNELIDAFNTREQDRSEQMARIVDKLCEHTAKIVLLENTTQPKDEEAPLPCPFCNHIPHFLQSFHSDEFLLNCVNDDCLLEEVFTGWYETKQEAINAWNKRSC